MNSKEWEKIKGVFSSTLELPEGERASFLADIDQRIKVEVEILLTNFESAESFIEEPAFVQLGLNETLAKDAFPGKSIDDYLILEEIGTGGMGAVYLAEQRTEDLSHRVALKLIKRGMDTNSVLKRFVQERQILANLEHPNIARFLDGGSTDDGLPYFVMEYVDGLPINKYCEKNGLDLRQRLELFRKVAAAVSFAHQNLIVHRDLKPSNILVAEGGEVKLLDFGIARLLNPDWSVDTNEATATMFRVMTPEYASPEQLRGLPATTSGDVYSLGVVLFEMLTGKRPYKIESRSPDEVAREVLTNEPVRPSSVVSGRWPVVSGKTKEAPEQTNPRSKIQNPKLLKGDLDNIILKALQKEKERRYSSVEEFSEDIRRHLDGLPVRATADTTIYRLKKFAERHRTGVLAGVSVFLVLLLATGLTTWQSIVAKRERDRAEQRFGQVRKLATTVLFDYHEGIKEMPGATAIREKMVKDSLDYLDNLANESNYSIDLQRELATAYRKVGDIQGGQSSGGNVGNNTAAMESYTKAFNIQQNIVAANQANTDDRRLLARLMIDIAMQHEFTGDLQGRENYARRAIEIFRQLAEELPNETKSHSDLARALWTLASAVRAKGDLDDAIVSYKQSAEIYENLAAQKPEDRKFIRNAALTYKNMGGLLEQKKDFSAALEFYGKASVIDAKNAAEEPDSITSQLDLSFSYGSIASASMNTGNFDEALENYRKKLAIQEKIAVSDAKNAFAQSSLAQTYQQFGTLWEKLEKYDEAVENFQKSIRIFEQLLGTDPKNTKRSLNLAESHSLLGDCLSNSAEKALPKFVKLTRLREALVSQKRGVDILEDLKSQNKLEQVGGETLAKAKKNWLATDDKIAKLEGK